MNKIGFRVPGFGSRRGRSGIGLRFSGLEDPLPILLLTLLVTGLSAIGADSAAPPPDPAFYAGNEELRAYLVEAAEQHPDLARQHAEWLAMLARIPQVTALDDPMFTYGQFLASPNLRMTARINQKFPWFGTRKKRGDMAAREAEAMLLMLYDMRNRIFADVKEAYYEYAFLGRQIDLMTAQLELLSYMEDVTRTKYGLGMAAQDEVLRTQIELERVRDEIKGMIQMRPALAAKLNQALGRPVYQEVPWPEPSAAPPAPPAAPFVEAWIRENNPQLESFGERLAAREVQIDLARLKGRPDFTIGLDYTSISNPRKIRPDRPYPASLNAARRVLGVATGEMPFDPINAGLDAYSLATSDEPMSYNRGGDDSLMLSVTVNLPIYRNKIRAGIEEARQRKAAVEHEEVNTRQTLETAARMTLYQIEDAQRRYTTFTENIVPKAEQSYSNLQGAYASGGTEVTFLDVFDSIGDLLTFELEELRALRDWHIAIGDLEYLMGGSWTDGEATTAPVILEAAPEQQAAGAEPQ